MEDLLRSLIPIWKALNVHLFSIGKTPVTVATIVSVLGILVFSTLLSKLAQRGVERAFRSRGVDREGTARAAGRLLHYSILLIGFAIAVQTVGIDLGALFAAGAIFAVGLGFAMQSIAQNFVAGVILLVERSIKPGDIVEVSEGMVRVVNMGIRSTIVETRDGENLIVPNSSLIQSTVKNYTFDTQHLRVCASVGVVYSSDMKTVWETLHKVTRELTQEWGVGGEEPLVVMTGFGDSSVNFDVGVWTKDPWQFRLKRSRLYDAIWWALKEKDITIAFPQLDVHLDKEAVDALRAFSSRQPSTAS